MVDQKVIDLPALTTPSLDDILLIIDDPSTTPADKKIALSNLLLDEDDMVSDSAVQGATQQSIKAYVDNSAVTVPTDGWTESADTWVYASASTFTIAGVDRTEIYEKGTRLRFKQGGGYKYAVVVDSTFSTNTTVTIAVNDDYTIANSAITDNDYSYQESPQGYPDWFDFTPTWGGFSSDPTFTMQYSIRGRTVSVMINSTGNGTSNATTLTFTLPVASATSQAIACVTGGDNNTALSEVGAVVLTASSATAEATPDAERTTSGWTASNGKSINCEFFYSI